MPRNRMGNRGIADLAPAIAGTLLLGCQHSLPPAPNLYAQTDSNWFADTPPALRTTTVDVPYLTDRAPTQEGAKVRVTLLK